MRASFESACFQTVALSNLVPRDKLSEYMNIYPTTEGAAVL